MGHMVQFQPTQFQPSDPFLDSILLFFIQLGGEMKNKEIREHEQISKLWDLLLDPCLYFLHSMKNQFIGENMEAQTGRGIIPEHSASRWLH